LFLFKYLFIVEKDIEIQIYDKHKNKELIFYEREEKIRKKSQTIKDILYIYPDYQMLNIENEELGTLTINPFLIEDMPSLLEGKYPVKMNEILLPNYIVRENKKVDLSKYINKEISFILNNEEEFNFKVTGIYDSKGREFTPYYNLKNIKNLLEKTSYNDTGNTRVLINHYKNLDKVIKNMECKGELYDSSGLEEIEVYQSLFNLVLLLISIMIIFITIMIIVVSSILYHDTKNDRFMQYALGYDNHKIALNYINYYLKILIISLIIAFMGYIIGTFLYNKYIFINNLILNDLFKISLDYTFLLPILILFLLLLILLYIIIRFRLFKQKISWTNF